MYRDQNVSMSVLAERSRNKERLKAGLAGLCELELLKHRQERLVLGALSLGDTGPGWGPLAPGDTGPGWQSARYNSDKPSCSKNRTVFQCQPALPGSYRGLASSLEPQVDVLRVDCSPTEPLLHSFGEASIGPQDGQLVCLSHMSALHSGMAEKEESWPSQDGHGNMDEDLEMVMGELKQSEPTEDSCFQAKSVETYILGLIQRSPLQSPVRPRKPCTSLVQDQRLLSCTAEGLSSRASTAEGLSSRASTAERLSSRASTAEGLSSKASTAEGLSSRASTAEGLSSRASIAEGLSSRASTAEGLSSRASTAEGLSSRASTAEGLSSRASTAEGLSSRASTAEGLSSRASTTEGLSSRASTAEGLSCRASTAEGLSSRASSSLDQDPSELMPVLEDVHVNHLHRQQPPLQPGHYPRTRKSSLINSPLSSHPTAGQDPSSQPDSPHHHSHHTPSSPSDQQLVNAQYIPAYPCQSPTHSFARALFHSHHPPGWPKARGFPAERSSIQQQLPPPLHNQSKSRAVPKKCRFSEERPAFKKPGKQACRSESENSLLGQRGVSEHKYNTSGDDGGGGGRGGGGGGGGRRGGGGRGGGGGGREGGRGGQTRGKKPQLSSGAGGASSSHRWCSTLEFSQDEQLPVLPLAPPTLSQLEAGICRRHRKAKLGPPRCAYSVSHPEPAHCGPLPDPSEASLSEADSPASSSLSSDYDETSGFVWPQQLRAPSPAGPPETRLRAPSPAGPPEKPLLRAPSPAGPPETPLLPKAFVKIKASHALKKKILRFHTGSLKVMTTV